MARLTELQLDALGESGNISMGAAATALSQLLGHNVQITTPRLSYTTMKEIRENHPVPCVVIRVNYTEGLIGSNIFILSDRDAGVIANMMMGDASQDVPETLDELYLSAVSEAMNQMMGSSATAMSEMFGRTIDITPPELEYVNLQRSENSVVEFEEDQQVIQIAFDLTVGEYINSTMLQLLPEEFAVNLVKEMMGDFEEQTDEQPPADPKSLLTPEEKDALLEVSRISMDSAAAAAGAMLGKEIQITPVRVDEITVSELCARETESYLMAKIEYQNALTGTYSMFLRERDAAVIAGMMIGSNDAPSGSMDEIQLSAAGEAVSQMLGAAVTALSDTFAKTIEIAPPQVCVTRIEEAALTPMAEAGTIITLTYNYLLEDNQESIITQVLPVDCARQLIGLLPETPVPENTNDEMQPSLPDIIESEPFDEGPAAQKNTPTQSADGKAKAVVPEENFPEGSVPLDLIRDISVRITGVLGRCKMTLAELTAVSAGAVVELDSAANEAVEILANGKLVARGQIVLYKDQLGVKITDIVQPWQRQ